MMADTSKSIMDSINEATVAAGGQPSGGSIVECLKHYYRVTTGDVPDELKGGNVNISDLAKNLIMPEGTDDSGTDDSGNDNGNS